MSVIRNLLGRQRPERQPVSQSYEVPAPGVPVPPGQYRRMKREANVGGEGGQVENVESATRPESPTPPQFSDQTRGGHMMKMGEGESTDSGTPELPMMPMQPFGDEATIQSVIAQLLARRRRGITAREMMDREMIEFPPERGHYDEIQTRYGPIPSPQGY